jgi:hypothetical protein
MTDQEEPEYQPSTIVNGHVLTQEGRWVTRPPLPRRGQPPQPPNRKISDWQPPQPAQRKMSGWKKVAIWVGGVFVLFAACSELSGTSDMSNTATSQPHRV